jgi:hypothetical protein
VYVFEAYFTLRSRPEFGFSFSRAIQLEEVTLETREGKIHGKFTMTLERDDYNSAEERARKEAERIALLLTLALGAGFVVEDVRIDRKPIIEEEGKVKKIVVSDYAYASEALVTVIRKYSEEAMTGLEAELQKLASKLKQAEYGEDLLRAIKWWRKGNMEEDGVDAFLHYYVAFEMLASLKGYKHHKREEWAKRFAEDYSITYKPDGKTRITDIRNWLVHARGSKKEKAEKLASQYADRFGSELLNAIKMIVNEGSKKKSNLLTYLRRSLHFLFARAKQSRVAPAKLSAYAASWIAPATLLEPAEVAHPSRLSSWVESVEL